MGRLKDKLSIIVGPSNEIGNGIAARFLSEGSRVAFVVPAAAAPTSSHVNPVAGAITSTVSNGESRKSWMDAVNDAIRQLGGVHVLVNNTLTRTAISPLETKTEADMDRAWLAVKAALWSAQAVVPTMKSQSWGRIVNVGSEYGQNMNAYNAEHNACSWALRGLMRTMATEWQRFGVHCNYLEVAADTADFRAYRNTNPEVIDALLSGTALQRRGDPKDDIGAAATMLACDETEWITGNVFFADGGQHLAAPVWLPATQQGYSPGANIASDFRVTKDGSSEG